MPKTIAASADGLEEARHAARANVPPGYRIEDERVITTGDGTASGVGETMADAVSYATRQVPSEARVMNQRELSSPATRMVTVEAFDEAEAGRLATGQTVRFETSRFASVLRQPRKGLWGLGRRPGSYEFVVTRAAVVEIAYHSHAKVALTALSEEEWQVHVFELTVADRPGPQHKSVAQAADLHVGDVVRIWHSMMENWIPGWWLEVTAFDGTQVKLRDLMSDEVNTRHVGSTTGANVYKHPDPEAARRIGQQPDARQQEERQRAAVSRRAPRAIDLAAAQIGRNIGRYGR